MLSENLRYFRKAKGLSQEELAIKLHIVRQTVSKWEKGLSVPDSGMLIRLAEELDTSVTVLLGETAVAEPDENAELKAIAAKLELLNEQFAARCERQRKLWRVIFVLLGVAALLVILFQLADLLHYQAAMAQLWADTTIIGGNDGPTNILCGSNIPFQAGKWLMAIAAAILAAVGIYKTRKR